MNRSRHNGSAIVEGVVGLWLIIAGVVGGTLLLANSGLLLLYKQKLSFVANQSASYASKRYCWNGAFIPGLTATEVEADTRRIADDMLSQLGLPKSISFKVDLLSEVTTVTIGISALPLLGNVDYLPKSILLAEEKGVAASESNFVPPAILALDIGHTTGGQDNLSVLLPCYGRNKLPTGSSTYNSPPGGPADGYAQLSSGAFSRGRTSSICMRVWPDRNADAGGAKLQVNPFPVNYSNSQIVRASDYPLPP